MTTAATPLEPAPAGLTSQADVFLKREDLHELGSFKWRGSLPVLQRYRSENIRRVVTSSTGNHGAASAWSASRLDIEAVVFVPEGVSGKKLSLLESHGASVRVEGDDFDIAKDRARAYALAEGLPYFEDGDEPVQDTGYESIADEIVDQLGGPPGTVLVPIGNGALLSGVGAGLARRSPETHRVGVVPRSAPVMALSLEAGQPVECAECDTFADGLAVRVAIPRAVDALAGRQDEIVLVSERELADGVRRYAEAGIRVEGAGAAALAGLDHVPDARAPVVLLVTGRNIDDDLHRRAVTQPESFSDGS